MRETPPTKGIKTSEFWLNIAALVIAILNRKLHLGLETEEILAILGLSGSYNILRTWLKRDQNGK